MEESQQHPGRAGDTLGFRLSYYLLHMYRHLCKLKQKSQVVFTSNDLPTWMSWEMLSQLPLRSMPGVIRNLDVVHPVVLLEVKIKETHSIIPPSSNFRNLAGLWMIPRFFRTKNNIDSFCLFSTGTSVKVTSSWKICGRAMPGHQARSTHSF